MITPARIWYEIRWWWWFLAEGRWPVKTLYGGPYHLDKGSRDIIIDRFEREHGRREPHFRGSYPHRRSQ